MGRRSGGPGRRRPERHLHRLRPGRACPTTATATASLVSQGKPETGLATNWNNDGYGWTGFGAPGDSGSPVVLTGSGEAAGNFTHLIVDLGTYPGSDLAGTRITKILQFAGVSLVNADGSTTGAASTSC